MKRIRDIASQVMHHEGPSAAGFFLFPFSLLYGGAVALRNRLYDGGIIPAQRLPRPVISVGNLTVGGTGKTPTVITVARLLLAKGYRPAVLSRGYGGTGTAEVHVVSNGSSVLMDHQEAGDEPVLIAKHLPSVPVLTGRRRVLTGKAAIDRFGADILILDDGFQHRALVRDVDIVLLDASRPFGNGRLLPRGTLREKTESLKRATALIMTGAAGATKGAPGFPALPPVPAFRGYRKADALTDGFLNPVEAPGFMKGKTVFAFSGIAGPDGFRQTLAPLCGSIAGFTVFPDHHHYDRNDIADLLRESERARADLVVTTEKDVIKLVDFPEFVRNIFALSITMEIEPASVFERTIMERIRT